ncbi:MAG: ABC transporter ATP-binding protein [Nocardioidaceae bacterium]
MIHGPSTRERGEHEGLPGSVGIHVEDVELVYHSREGETHALAGVSMHVRPGELVCLIGPSGCGKTSLLDVIAGFINPSRGQVRFGEHGVGGRVDKGIVFQEYALFPWLTALGNVEFGLRMQGVPGGRRRQVALEHLRLVGLESVGHQYPHHLSGGMKQRVAIARALAFDPAVLLMDEPFGALDSFTREELQKLIVELSMRTGKTILYVTHNLSEAVFLADRIVIFASNPGRIVHEMNVELPRPRDPLDEAFVRQEREAMTYIVGERRGSER